MTLFMQYMPKPLCNEYIHNNMKNFFFLVLVLLCSCKMQKSSEGREVLAVVAREGAVLQPAGRRPEGVWGFWPEVEPVAWGEQGAWFPRSVYGSELPMLNFPEGKPPHTLGYVRVISPESASSWEEAGINDARWNYFLIMPGDYRAWGPLVLRRSGSARARRILRYYNPSLRTPYTPPHPVKMAGDVEREVLLESFEMQGADYWVLHGLTFRGKASKKRGLQGGLTSKIKPGSDYNIIDFCLFEQFLGLAAIRILQANHNLIQRCVFRDKVEGLGVDMGGIVISAREGQEARGNLIVGNEFYNLSDAVGLLYNVPRKGNPAANAQTGSVPATVIENNDIYIEPRLYRQKSDGEWACAEDGLDIKVGTKSARPEDRIRILNNRIWGFRPTDQSCGGSGSTGVGILLHRQASNILIKGNIIFNTAQGIVVFGDNPKKPGEKVENIAIENNLIYDIRHSVQREQIGLALKLIAPCEVQYNTVCKAEELLFVHPRQSRHRIRYNVFKDIRKPVGELRLPADMLCEENLWMNVPDPGNLHGSNKNDRVLTERDNSSWSDYVIYCRRWTGPEKMIFKDVLLKK